MKGTKLVVGLIAVMSACALAGCNKADPNAVVDRDYVLAAEGELPAGYTSLANTKANAKVRADGKYVAGGHEFTTKDTYKTTYSAELNKVKLNYLTNQWTINSYHYCNMVDGMVENDKYGNICGAIAQGYKVTENAEDGSETWSIKIKENVEWVDNKTGKTYAKLVAKDFVEGMKYVLNPANGSGTAGIPQSVIKGSAEYFAAMKKYNKGEGDKPDFASVGIKAVGDYVVEYTLYQPTPYFLTCLTYSPYLPVNIDYLESQGTDFGQSVNNILVNGAFRITTHDIESQMMYTKNYHYYDRDHVYVDHVKRVYVPGTATSATTREWFESGVIDAFSVNATDEKGWKKYVTGEDSTGSLKSPYADNCTSTQSYGDAVYVGYWNFNRSAWDYTGTSQTIKKTDAQKAATAYAVLNKTFRKAFMVGCKTTEYLKRYDKTNPENFLMRSYTNRDLCAAGGKDYCDYVDDVYNEKTGSTGKSLTGIIAGEDVVYNPTEAGALFAQAKTELKGAGLTDADFPIYIDVIQSQSPSMQPLEKAMYDAIENASNGICKINYNLAATDSQDEEWGSEVNNYDYSIWSGWGPDYADPNTYLHTFAKGDGDNIEYLGLAAKTVNAYYAAASGVTTVDALQDYVLGAYDAKYRTAAAVVDPTKTVERYEKFAEAEYSLIFEECLVAPWMSPSGYTATVANTVAWQAGRASYGLTGDKFKNVVVSNETITKAIKQALTQEYEAGR